MSLHVLTHNERNGIVRGANIDGLWITRTSYSCPRVPCRTRIVHLRLGDDLFMTLVFVIARYSNCSRHSNEGIRGSLVSCRMEPVRSPQS